MFTRTSIAASSLIRAKAKEEHAKTDDQLMKELQEEGYLNKNEEEEELDHEQEFLAQFRGSWLGEKWGGSVGLLCKRLVNGRYEAGFNVLLTLAIVLAGILVGVETYPELANTEASDGLDIFCVAVFAAEIVAKIIAEGLRPWNFFIGPSWSWNSFDFIVVIVCMPKISDSFGNSSPTVRLVSRLARLLRVSKVIHHFPALQIIVKGLFEGLKSIGYVAILLIIWFFLYGVFGVYLFGDNDPFYFRDVQTALISLFRVCTLEGWTEVMYVNIYGCDVYDGGIYMQLGQMPAINVTSATGETYLDEWGGLNYMYRCTAPSAQPELAGAFFISFVIISSLILLSLFVGVITMSMQSSIDEMRQESEEVNRKKTLAKQMNDMKELAKKQAVLNIAKQLRGGRADRESHFRQNHPPQHGHHRQDDTELLSDSSDSNSSDSDNGDGSGGGGHKKKHSMFRQFFHRASRFINHFRGERKNKDGTVVRYMTHKEKKKMRDMAEMKILLMQAWSGTHTNKVYHTELDVAQDGKIEKYLRWAGVYSRAVVEDTRFQNFITFVIILTAIVEGIAADNKHPDPALAAGLEVVEDVIYYIFTAEVALRLASEEFHLKEYFTNPWNVFDFLVVVLGKLPGVGIFSIILRLVRLLRVLKLVKFLPQLQVIVNALLMSFSSIGYILSIMFLSFYMFAILGIIAFRDNDKSNFGTLTRALVTLFKVSTMDNWGCVMYTNIYGCDVYPPPHSQMAFNVDQCDTPQALRGWAVFYFVLFVVVGALVMVTLFVGVVTTSMEESAEQQAMEHTLEARIREVSNENSVTPEQLDIYRRVFAMLDLDGGGTIEPAELELGLKCVNIHPTERQMLKWVKEVDVNFDGVIDQVRLAPAPLRCAVLCYALLLSSLLFSSLLISSHLISSLLFSSLLCWKHFAPPFTHPLLSPLPSPLSPLPPGRVHRVHDQHEEEKHGSKGEDADACRCQRFLQSQRQGPRPPAAANRRGQHQRRGGGCHHQGPLWCCWRCWWWWCWR